MEKNNWITFVGQPFFKLVEVIKVTSLLLFKKTFQIAMYTAKNHELLKVVENRIEQCCAAHIVEFCQQYIVQHCYTRLRAWFRLNNLYNIVDNIEQCGQHNILQSCFQ